MASMSHYDGPVNSLKRPALMTRTLSLELKR